MSAIGTKRTYRVALHMSAFGGKADMTSLGFHALFLPKAGGSLCELVGSQSMNSQSRHL